MPTTSLLVIQPPVYGQFWYWLFHSFALLLCPLFYYFIVKRYYRISLTAIDIVSYALLVVIIGWAGSLLFATIERLITVPYLALSNLKGNVGERWYGALILMYLYILCRDFKFSTFLPISIRLDVLAATACLILCIGKIGCFLSGHFGCYGTYTSLPWGTIFKNETTSSIYPVHPIQIYDSLFHLILLVSYFILLNETNYKAGIFAFTFLFATSIYNIFIELLRTNKSVIFHITLAQITYSLIIIIALSHLSFILYKVERKDSFFLRLSD